MHCSPRPPLAGRQVPEEAAQLPAPRPHLGPSAVAPSPTRAGIYRAEDGRSRRHGATPAKVAGQCGPPGFPSGFRARHSRSERLAGWAFRLRRTPPRPRKRLVPGGGGAAVSVMASGLGG
ncbi:hypothetical protein SUZIE_206670 [Sciurus carolinensis]|uniref:Uncharacterized protein n=1 Tax=Sciurus carolinensis TaxID=30640 RepID=A0AA41NGW6_SCICA|nr:hypothetical protein [Sciurus carolinensis]